MQLIELSIDQSGSLHVAVNSWLIIICIVILVLFAIGRYLLIRRFRTVYEINEAEIGIGNNKIKIRPNREDLQIAYQLWVELKTRKLGIVIDENNDVIHEVYNSWYEFFKITRELIKSIPAQKVRNSADTRALVSLSMKILNEGLRPHLTAWQARYRRWYDQEVQNSDNKQLPPQSIQKKFAGYSELIADMKRVNNILLKYASLLESMIHEKMAKNRQD